MVDRLGRFNVGTILDYSVEGGRTEREFEAAAKELMRTMLGIIDTDKAREAEAATDMSQGIEIDPFILKADGAAATAQLQGGAGIANLGLQHGSCQPHGWIGPTRALQMQGNPLLLRRFGQHQGQLAAPDNADPQGGGRPVQLARQGGISAQNHLAPAAGQSSSLALKRAAPQASPKVSPGPVRPLPQAAPG